jgi:hypothetical protein
MSAGYLSLYVQERGAKVNMCRLPPEGRAIASWRGGSRFFSCMPFGDSLGFTVPACIIKSSTSLNRTAYGSEIATRTSWT